MAQTPAEGHPDKWLHDRLQVIEQAVLALVEAAQSHPEIDEDDSKRLIEAAQRLRGGASQKQGD